MPRKGEYNQTGLPARIRGWLTAHPGTHRPRDIADGLGVPDDEDAGAWRFRVARALVKMHGYGHVVRVDRGPEGKRAQGHYGMPTDEEEGGTVVREVGDLPTERPGINTQHTFDGDRVTVVPSGRNVPADQVNVMHDDGSLQTVRVDALTALKRSKA